MDDSPLPIPSNMSPKIPEHQLAWDSTSLGDLKTCPRKYYYRHIKGYTSKGESPHLVFGKAYHAALEEYDRQRSQGIGHRESTLASVRRALRETQDIESGQIWESDEPTKTRLTLVRSVVWYLDHFKDDPLETVQLNNGKPAVELSFQIPLRDLGIESSLTGEEYLLCGHLDRLVRWQGKVWVTDRKSTKGQLSQHYFSQYSPDNQMSLYSIAGTLIYNQEIAGIVIDAAQIAVGFTRFQRGIIYRTPSQLQEWIKDLTFHLRIAESYADASYWPQNDKSCNLYGGCVFREVCGSAPEIRSSILKYNFTTSFWNPLEPR